MMIFLTRHKICTIHLGILFLLPLLLPLSAAQNTGAEIIQYGYKPSPDHVYDEVQDLPWYRYLDTPGHQEAEEHIFSRFLDYGLEVSKQEYIGQRPDGEVDCVNILGYLEGKKADQWVVIGGHYDTNPLASQGAYDNGVGIGTVLELARLFTQVETEKPRISIMFAAWDAEEGGGAGSSYFVENLDQGVDVVAYINLDMFGLNYPVRNPLYYLPTSDEEYTRLYMYTSPIEDFSRYDVEYSDETLENFATFRSGLEEITYEKWQYPSEWVTVLDDTESNSDQRFFIQEGIPAVWFRGMHENSWEEGDTNEQTFKHSPGDTLATMEAFAGGKSNLLKGFETALIISYNLSQEIAGLGEQGSQEEENDNGFLGFSEVKGRDMAIVAIFSLVLTTAVVVAWKRL